MKLFRDLLLENPDTVYYKRKTYSYRSPANKCAFLVYKDEKSGKNAIFGYSYEKDFYCDDAEVLKEVEELHKQASIKLDTGNNSDNQLSYWAQRAISNLKNGNSGGGHLDIENLLKGIGRFGAYADPLLKGRIFEVYDAKDVVDDSDLKIESTIPSGKAIIVTFWDARREKIVKYKDQYEKVITFNGYDPKECLYEQSMKFYTYDNFYNDGPSISEKPSQTTTSNTTDTAPWSTHTTGESVGFKVGDKVKVRGMKTSGVVVSIAGDKTTIRITDTDVQGISIGSEKTVASFFLDLEPNRSVAGTKASDSFSVGDKVKVKGMNIAGVVLSINAANTVKLRVTNSGLQTVPVGSEFDFPYYGLQLDTSHTTKFKVGDKIKLKGLSDITGDVTHVDGNYITIEITSSKYSVGAFRQGRALKILASGAELVQPQSDDTVAASVKLDKVIHNKNKELVVKSSELHSKKTIGKNDKPLTPKEKVAKEKEVNGLEFEIKILNDLLASGEKYYTDNVKDVVATSVQRKLHALEKEKKNRYSLIAQAEKQYGMPIAQIRQKYNVPLDQLVKKESLYKKLLKTLRG